jgi:hypothetical protein
VSGGAKKSFLGTRFSSKQAKNARNALFLKVGDTRPPPASFSRPEIYFVDGPWLERFGPMIN